LSTIDANIIGGIYNTLVDVGFDEHFDEVAVCHDVPGRSG
jgi:hypothetical protein